VNQPLSDAYRAPTSQAGGMSPRLKGILWAVLAPMIGGSVAFAPIALRRPFPWFVWLPIWIAAVVVTGLGVHLALWRKEPRPKLAVLMTLVVTIVWVNVLSQAVTFGLRLLFG